jgi:hypothetical protein
MTMCNMETPASAAACPGPSPPASASATRPAEAGGPGRHSDPRVAPDPPPRCGAKARSGAPCRGPAMPNGRCRMHGGRSTGPRTPEGLARMIAANTTHGMCGMAGAAQRAQQRYVRTLAARIRLTCAAVRLRAYLPPEMAARLGQNPPELRAPMHLSQEAFEWQAATLPCNGLAPGYAPGASVGVGSPASDAGAGRTGSAGEPAQRGREAERLAARAEAAARAPWKAAIAFARAAKRVARGASVGVRKGKMCKTRSYPMRQPGASACVTLGSGTVEAGALGSGGLEAETLRSAAGRVGPQAPVPGACRGAVDPGVRPRAKRFDWAAVRAAKRLAKRLARGASSQAGTDAICEMRSYPMQPPAHLAPAPAEPIPAEPATGQPCPLALDSALVPGACPRVAEPRVGPMGQRLGRVAARAAKYAAKRLARASTPAGTGTMCEMRSYPMQPPAALAPSAPAAAAAEPARSGPCPLAIDPGPCNRGPEPGPCNRGVEPGVGPMGQRRGRAAARSAKRAAKRAAKRLARGASPPAGTGTMCETRSYPMQGAAE